DEIPANPLSLGGNQYASITSYVGNGGRRTMPPDQATADGMFHTTGSGALPSPRQRPGRITDVADGTSNTLPFGERYHLDGADDSWPSAPIQPQPTPPMQNIGSYGIWAPFGPDAAAHVLCSGSWTINYSQPNPYRPPPPPPPPMPPPPPPIVPWPSFEPFYEARLSAFGSGHSGGAHFALPAASPQFTPP